MLESHDRIGAGSRTQFMAVAANTMRRILVDYARTRKRDKRGGGATRIPLEEVEPFLSDDASAPPYRTSWRDRIPLN